MECFTIMSNEIEGRIDPFYYKPEFRELEKNLSKIKAVPFREIIKNIINGFDYRKFTEEGLTYLRVSNIKPFEFDLTDVKKIRPSFEITKKIRLKRGDLLLTRKGTFGIALSLDKGEDYIISSEIFKIELSKQINSKFVEIVLNSSICQKQFNKYKIGGIMGSLSQEAVKQIKIPLPPLPIQNRIVQLMDNAYNLKKQKEAEAKKLLDSINDYVLSELGIKLPELKDKMTFVVYANDVKGGRLDPYYYQPKFKEIEKAIEKGKYEVVKFSDIFEKAYINDKKVSKGDKYILSIDSKKGIIKEIGIFGSEIYKKTGGTRRQIQHPVYKHYPKSLVISRINIQRGGCFILDEHIGPIYSTNEFYSYKSKKASLDFVFFLIRNPIFLKLINKEISGQFGRFKEAQFLNLKIPLPPFSIQNKIAEEVKRRMHQAEQLQKEANEVLEKAKQKVEKIILGEES